MKPTDLLPCGYERFKERNNLFTPYSTNSGRETSSGVRREAELLNEYHFLLDTGIIVGGITVGLTAIVLGGIGVYKLYQTINTIIDNIF